MIPLNCPRLVERLAVYVELLADPDIGRGPAYRRISDLWLFWQNLWEVHSRVVVMPRYLRAA